MFTDAMARLRPSRHIARRLPPRRSRGFRPLLERLEARTLLANMPPSFTPGDDVFANEDSGAFSAAWATDISVGPPEESAQIGTFQVDNDNPTLFSTPPAIAANGTLSFTPAGNAHGSALVSVVLMDNGGTDDGGDDTSDEVSFTITVRSVNDEPTFTPGSTVTLMEESGAYSAAWATAPSTGPLDESGQSAQYQVQTDRPELFAVAPSIAPDGTLAFTLAANAHGNAQLTVSLVDDGGVENGGDDTSAPSPLTITISPINDPPTFTPGGNVLVAEDSGAYSAAWATNVSPGPSFESTQSVQFQVVSDDLELFSIPPAIAPNGTLSFTPARDAFGSANVQVTLVDSGGTDDGGDDTSETVSFTLSIAPVLDVRINEFSAANPLADEDLDLVDWIELYNTGTAAEDLGGASLTADDSLSSIWQIPAGTILAPGSYRIVFASGKNRTGTPLHTDFTLPAAGGYVALVADDGFTVVSQYYYAAQSPVQSHGVVDPLSNATLLGTGNPVRVHIPASGALGATWTGLAANEPFNDSAGAGWIAGTGAVGFESPPATSGFTVTTRSTIANTLVRSVTEAEAVLSGQRVSQTSVVNHSVINFIDTILNPHQSHFGGDAIFGSGGAFTPVDNFVVRAVGTIWVTPEQAGLWTFGITSDDGYRLRIDGIDVMQSDFFNFGDHLGYHVLTPGPHALDLVYFESIQVAEIEFYAARGHHSELNASFALVGANVPGALATGGFAQRINTNVRAPMENINSTAYVRYPFSIANARLIDGLSIDVEYNDGFIAHLNGQQVASVNAPASPTFNSAAEQAQPLARTVLNLTPFISQLRTGGNVLAFQSLSSGLGDRQFYLNPRLNGRTLGVAQEATFIVPTPGGRNGGRDPVISEVMASNAATLLDDDLDSRDWLEVFNPGATDLNLGGWYLTDDSDNLTKWPFPDTTLPAGGYLTVFASEKNRGGEGRPLHTNFRLDAAGEFIALVKPDGTTIASQYGQGSVTFPDQRVDVSYGVDGPALSSGQDLTAAPRVFFTSPTPGAANGAGLTEIVSDPVPSVRHGVYSSPFNLALVTPTPGAVIRYTTNGSTPTLANGIDYTAPIAVTGTTTLRAAAFRTGSVSSEVITSTYLFLGDVITQSPAGQSPAGWPAASINGQIFNYGMDPDIVNHPVYGPQMIDALESLPSLSIVTDLPNLFDPVSGIYVNGTENGRQWERPISIEVIEPDGNGTTASAGLRIRGQTSSFPQNSRHSFRVFFRDEYGDDNLAYPLFGAEGADQFDSFDLRLDHLYSWSFATYDNATFVRDAFSPDTQRAMGQPYLRSKFHHLYLNGQYWGVYQLQERADSDYASTNYGGSPDDYDVIKADNQGFVVSATDGNLDAWRQLWAATMAGFATDVQYFAAQGRNSDGTINPGATNLVDVDNVIDYMILMYYVGQWDGPITLSQSNLITKNWFGFRNRADNEGFKFLAYDSETSLEIGAWFNHVGPYQAGGLHEYFNPQFLHQRLMDNANYRTRFADRLSAYWSEGGLLDPDVAAARHSERASEIETAIAAESARWGDTIRATPYTPADWAGAVQDINRTYFPHRERYLGTRFEQMGWYPTIDAPVLSSSGGVVPPGHLVTASVPSRPTVPTTVPVAFFSTNWRFLANGSNQGTAWRATAFDDATWPNGVAEFGFGGGDESTIVPFGPSSSNKFITTYFRRHFNIADASQLDFVRVTLAVDDGAIVYVNGQEVARTQMPAGTVGHQTLSSMDSDDFAPFFAPRLNGFSQKEFDIPASAFVTGDNVLAIEYHLYSQSDADMSFNVELRGFLTVPRPPLPAAIYYTTDGTDPRRLDGLPEPTAQRLDNTVTLVDRNTPSRFRVPSSLADGTGWEQPVFDDTTWTDGTAGVGFDLNTADAQPGFTVRTIDTSSGGIWDSATATALLNGNTAGFTISSDTTKRLDYIQFEDDRSIIPTPGTVDREQYAMRITSTLTIPSGTWTLALSLGVGWGGQIPGVTILSQIQSGAYVLVALNAGGGAVSNFLIDAFEQSRTDFFDILIAPGNRTAIDGAFALLQNGQYGWRATTTTTGNVSFTSAIGTDVRTPMSNIRPTIYNRIPFQATDVANVTGLSLSMQYDDGFIVFLNGTEVARRNSVASPTFLSAATNPRADADALTPLWLDLTSVKHLLVEGNNVLAVRGMNFASNNVDFLITPKLEAVYAPSSITVDATTHLKARALVNGIWSPLTETTFSTVEPAAAGNFAVTELNYHPADPTPEELAVNPTWDENAFEFLELRNIGPAIIDLSGVQFVRGISFAFPTGAQLAPGEFTLLARNSAALAERYGGGLNILGTYSGNLSNAGETLTFIDISGEVIQEFTYSDQRPWPTRADGLGATLEAIDATGDYNDSDNFNSSDEYGGSPGALGTGPIDDVMVNEVLTHTDTPLVDAIELHNLTAADIDIGGWYLSDTSDNYRKYRIPDGTLLPANGYLVFDEADFNPTPATPGPDDFSLDGAHGDDVWLMKADAVGELLRFVDDVSFDAAAAGESWGRWPNGTGDLYPMATTTFGGFNSGPRIGPVIIGELVYNHGPSPTDDDLEFIEVTNITASAVDISGWRFDAGVDFTFPTGTILPANGSLVVLHFDPLVAGNAGRLAAFQAAYGIGGGVSLIGGYFGVLDNGGETVRLVRPDAPPPDDPLFIPYILVDEVTYDDVSPWPSTPDGGGTSLTRNSAAIYGRETSNRRSAPPSPGTTPSQVVGRRVFYNGSVWDGGSVLANSADDGAIATDKIPLLPGQTAGFVNFTTTDDGLTGVMLDIFGLPTGASLSSDDFEFRIGNFGDPSTWALAPAPSAIAVRGGAGEAGSDRVSITWEGGAIVNQWLQVTVKATADTALAAADLHYWGSAVGDTGNLADDFRVDFADRIAVLSNQTAAAAITNRYDINRDGVVDNADAALVDANANAVTGDLNRDDHVGSGDLAPLQNNFGTAVTDAYFGDIVGDGTVDRDDAVQLLTTFGQSATPEMLARRLTRLSPPASPSGSSAAPTGDSTLAVAALDDAVVDITRPLATPDSQLQQPAVEKPTLHVTRAAVRPLPGGASAVVAVLGSPLSASRRSSALPPPALHVISVDNVIAQTPPMATKLSTVRRASTRA